MVKQISDNEIYLLIKYIKSVLWRVAKRLSYKEGPRCLKVNERKIFSDVSESRSVKYYVLTTSVMLWILQPVGTL